MKSVTLVADSNDEVALYQIRTDNFVITDETGHIQQVIDERTEEYNKSADDSRITFIHTYDDTIIIATEQQVYSQHNESLLNPMSELQKLDPLDIKILLSLNTREYVTYITNYGDNLLFGYSDGIVKEFNMTSKEENTIAKLEDAVINIQNYKNQILLFNDISGHYILYLIHNKQILCSGNGSSHARGFKTFQKLAPSSLLINDYFIYSNGHNVIGQLPDSQQKPQFISNIPNCQMIKHVKDQNILLVTDSQFILAAVGVELKVLESINFNRGQYAILGVETYINKDQQLVVTCLYNDNDDQQKYVAKCTFKDPIQVRQDGLLDTRYTTEQLIREVNILAANKKNAESFEDAEVQKKRDTKKDSNKVHYIDDSDDSELEHNENHKQLSDSEESNDNQDEKLNNILKILDEMRNQQPIVSNKSISHIVQPIQLSSNQTRETAKRLLKVCRHGHATLSKGQNYSVAFHFVDDQYTDKILHSKNEIIACDIQEDAICYVSTSELHVQQKINQGKHWYAGFSQIQKPALVSLGNSDYCAVAFESGVVLIYVNGVVTQQLYYANLVGMSACNSTLLIITTESFQLIDMNLMKVVYSNAFVPIGNLLFCELIDGGLCIAQDHRFIYMLNYQNSIDDLNAIFVPVHSCAEQSIKTIQNVHDIVRRVIKPQSDGKSSNDSNQHQKLLRSDVEQLVPYFSQVIYIDVDEQGAPLVYTYHVPQRVKRLTQAYEYLTVLLKGRDMKDKRSLENLFTQDIAAIKNRFPEQFRVEMPVVGLPDVHECHLSPPINQNSPGIELDPLERELYLQGIILNAQLTFYMNNLKKLQIAQLRYDMHVLSYARECLIRGDDQRLLTAVRLFRSQKILQEFYGLVVNTNNHTLTEHVMAILQDNFDNEQQFQVDNTVAQSNLGLLSSGDQNGLFSMRQEELYNQYGKTDNPGMINQARAQFRAELNDQVALLEARIEQSQKASKTRSVAPVSPSVGLHASAMAKKEEEENLPAPNPHGNRDFLQMLRRGASGTTPGANQSAGAPTVPQTPQKQTLKLASSTTSPKKSGLNLGSVISK